MKAYNTGFSHWVKDPAWMITKCAISKAIRGACPNETGAMVTQEELSTPNLDKAIERTDHIANAKKKAATKKKATKPAKNKTEPIHDDWDAKLAKAESMFAKADDEEAIQACLEIFPEPEIATDIGIMADDAQKRIANN